MKQMNIKINSHCAVQTDGGHVCKLRQPYVAFFKNRYATV
jgi:hypothetical protein